MVDRPLENIRPVGPFINTDSSDTDQNSNDNKDPLLETAEKWYQSISREQNKRKMMKNYLTSTTNLTEDEIDARLNEAGL